MKSVSLVFPHQLFSANPSIKKDRDIYLIEEILFFRQYNFHRQKLVLHRASMKAYEAYLHSKKYNVNYIETTEKISDIRFLIKQLAKQNVTEIHYTNTVDNWLEKRIDYAAKTYKVKLVKYPTPNFLNQTEDLNQFFANKKTYFQTDFYIDQRKKRNLLLEQGNKPIGGKWTYDAENRMKFPKNETVPAIRIPGENKYVK